MFIGLVRTDIADAASEHNGLMVAVAGIAHTRLKGAEVPENIRATEFVIKGRGANWALGHNRVR